MTSKIKIIHVMQSLEVGGLENGVVNLANSIDKTAFDIVLCCIKREGLLRERLDKSIRVKCLHEKEGFNPFRIFLLARFFSMEKPDIIHMHGWGSDLVSGVIGARLAKVPIVVNGEHGVLYTKEKRRVIAQKFLYNLIDYTVPVSYSIKADLVKALGLDAGKIFPIINGVNADRFRSNAEVGHAKRMELKFSKDDVVIGSVGRLEYVKGYDIFFHAAKEVLLKHPLVKFVLVGDGSERGNLEKLAFSLGISKSVIFLGARSDVPDLINMMDIYAMTSRKEGLSNTILEAMACGKPVVATRVGDNKILVEDRISGYLADVDDLQSITRHIGNLINDYGLRKRLGDAGLKRVRDRFQLSAMVSAYEKLYKLAIDGKKGN